MGPVLFILEMLLIRRRSYFLVVHKYLLMMYSLVLSNLKLEAKTSQQMCTLRTSLSEFARSHLSTAVKEESIKPLFLPQLLLVKG